MHPREMNGALASGCRRHRPACGSLTLVGLTRMGRLTWSMAAFRCGESGGTAGGAEENLEHM